MPVDPSGAEPAGPTQAPARSVPPSGPQTDPSAATPALAPVLPPEPDLGDEVVDPWGLEAVVARLSAGSRRAGLVPLGLLGVLLDDGERVEALVQGTYQHHGAVVALTTERLVLVNERRWVPDVRHVPITADLVVQGWQDEHHATLVLASEGRSLVLSGIADRPLARDLARRTRALVHAAGGPPPP